MLENNAGYYQTCRGPLPLYLSSNIIYKNEVNKSKKALRSLSCNCRRRQQFNLPSASTTYVLHQGNNYLYSSIPYCKLVMRYILRMKNIKSQKYSDGGFPVHSTNKNKNAPVLAAIILHTVSVKCKKTKKLPWTMRIIPATILSNYCEDEKLKKLSSKKDNFTNYFGLKKLNKLSKSPIYEMISIPNLKLQEK